MSMKRGKRLDDLQELKQNTGPVTDQDVFWDTLISQVDKGSVIPIVSSQMIYDLVFSRLLEVLAADGAQDAAQDAACAPEVPTLKATVTSALSNDWAVDDKVQYPFPDSYELARVAQYVLSRSLASGATKVQYIRFLKEYLIWYAKKLGADREHLSELLSAIDENTFTDLVVKELKLLNFGPDCTDPLSVLASLDLPIYITTSYHDFLERALIAMGKKPITQVCGWLEKMPPLREEHRPPQLLTPTPLNPVVFHLFGLEDYPLTMVLAEDDYLDFLVQVTIDRTKVTIDRDASSAIIPSYLQSPLATSWLMLLGFGLTGWDFRTLFRGVINQRGSGSSLSAYTNTIIQISLTDQYNLPNDEELRSYLVKAQDYMQQYFSPMQFKIEWKSPASFLTDLIKEKRKRVK